MTEPNISQKKTVLYLIRFSFGTSLLILPFTVVQLGAVNWMFLLLLVNIVMMYTCYLLKKSFLIMFDEYKERGNILSPYTILAGYVGRTGVFGKIVGATLSITLFLSSVALVLLTATILNQSFEIRNLSDHGQIRLWSAVIIILIAPLMIFKDRKTVTLSSLFALVTALAFFICALAVLDIIGSSKNYLDELVKHSKLHKKNFFVTFGTMMFVIANTILTFPDISILVKAPDKLAPSIFFTFGFTFIIQACCGLIPFVKIGPSVRPTVSENMLLILKNDQLKHSFKWIVILGIVSICLHMIFETILSLRKMFRSAQDDSAEVNWKRMGVQFFVLVLHICVTLLVPNFQAILSIAGGFFVTLTCVIFPLIIYIRLHDVTRIQKLVFTIIILSFLIMAFMNFFINLINIVDVIKQIPAQFM